MAAESASRAKIAWTSAQLRGITTLGASLLVSAAAGSGKTAMLAERCAQLVCDPNAPCDIDQLLVVTFTEAAAAQMRSRIAQALRQRQTSGEPGAERAVRQLQLLDQASISTLHAFCARLLRQHFQRVGLDPAFTVLEGDESALLRLEVGRALMLDSFGSDDDGEFQRLVERYADGRDQALLERIIRAHDLTQSLIDPEGWCRHARHQVKEAAEGPLGESELGREYNAWLASQLAAAVRACEATESLIESLNNFPKYLDRIEELKSQLTDGQTALEQGGLDRLAAIELNFSRLPPYGTDVPDKLVAKGAMDDLIRQLKHAPWQKNMRFSAAEWRTGLANIYPSIDRFTRLVELFGCRFADAKRFRGALDFSDLERFALRALSEPTSHRTPSTAARALHRQFKHVLVDEYQDINELQDAILSLASHECLAARPPRGGRNAATSQLARGNMFCVGDVKQSIYRFRLAEPKQFLDRVRQYQLGDGAPHGEVIDMQENFRSRAPLLDAINYVFERLMTEEAAEITYGLTHRLRAGASFIDGGAGGFTGAPIELRVLTDEALPAPAPPSPALTASVDDEEDASDDEADADATADDALIDMDRTDREAAFVARRIRELLGQVPEQGQTIAAPRLVIDDGPDGQKIARPIRQGDIVILLRAMRFKADAYVRALSAAGIPVHSANGSGFFDAMEIHQAMALLSLIDNRHQDIPMAAALRNPLWGIAEPESAMVTARLAYADEAPPLHMAIVRYASEGADAAAANLRAFLEKIERWRTLLTRRPLGEALASIYEETGLLTYVAGLTGGRQRAANLIELRRRAAQFDTFGDPSLARFLAFLESLREETDKEQAPLSTSAEDVVRIMSIHGSKGLEFPVVIAPDLGKKINLRDSVGTILLDRAAGIGMPVVDWARQIRYPSMASLLVERRVRRLAMAEELRVLYVAMTRAREHLILVGSCKAATIQKWAGRWARHRGPLPADAVLSASTMLDWLGAVAHCVPKASGPVIAIFQHDDADIARLAEALPARRASDPGRLARLAALTPIEPPLVPSPEADATIERLSFVYPRQAAVECAAAMAVTSYHKRMAINPTAEPDAPALVPGGVMGNGAGKDAGGLPLPRFGAAGRLTAADIGTATHLVLEHLDFTRPCDAQDLRKQIGAMVERRWLTAEMASTVDFEGLRWLIDSEVGRLMRAQASRLLRELPIVFPAALCGESSDPMDRTMVRGRIDLLIPVDDHFVLVDFKTDALLPLQVQSRAQEYGPQLEAYRQAIERIVQRPVARTLIAFINPRVIHEILPRPLAPAAERA